MHAYPRPQMERSEWINLNGSWEFSIDENADWTSPSQPPFETRIQVPFSPETPASGVSAQRTAYLPNWIGTAVK